MTFEIIADILALGFILVGLFFMFVGAIGVIRMPDAYNRLHAVSKCSTLGIIGLAVGAMFHVGTLAVFTKAAMVMIFALVATPVGSHMLAKAAHLNRMKPWHKTISDELIQDEQRHEQSAKKKDDVKSASKQSAGQTVLTHADA